MVDLRVVIGVYALLMALASLQMYKENAEKVNIVTGGVSIVLVIVSVFIGQPTFVIFSIIALVYYQVSAIWQGVSHNEFHWRHHTVRLLFTILMITLLIYVGH